MTGHVLQMNRFMTAGELNILLHYFHKPDEHLDVSGNPGGIQNLVDICGLLKDSAKKEYELTERGHAYMHAVLNTPLPIQIWVMPS